jgi:hypothetical protein
VRPGGVGVGGGGFIGPCERAGRPRPVGAAAPAGRPAAGQGSGAPRARPPSRPEPSRTTPPSASAITLRPPPSRRRPSRGPARRSPAAAPRGRGPPPWRPAPPGQRGGLEGLRSPGRRRPWVRGENSRLGGAIGGGAVGAREGDGRGSAAWRGSPPAACCRRRPALTGCPTPPPCRAPRGPLGKAERGRAADAAGSAGDHRDLPLKRKEAAEVLQHLLVAAPAGTGEGEELRKRGVAGEWRRMAVRRAGAAAAAARPVRGAQRRGNT